MKRQYLAGLRQVELLCGGIAEEDGNHDDEGEGLDGDIAPDIFDPAL